MTTVVTDLQCLQGKDTERGIPRWTAELLRALRQRGLMIAGVLNPNLESLDDRFADCFDVVGDNSRSFLRELASQDDLAYLCPSMFEPVRPIRALLPSHVVDSRIPVVAVAHDLTNELFPSYYQLRRGDDRLFTARRILFRTADAFLTNSRSTASDLIRYWHVAPDRVAYVGTGISDIFLPAKADSETLERLGITKPFVYCVGRDDPRKRTRQLIESFARLPTNIVNGFQLVITCRLSDEVRSAWMDVARSVGLSENSVVLTGLIDDATLRGLYSCCSLFVEPSEYEGFGLPAAEAAACGAVVIVSNSSSLPEILEFPDATFDSHDFDSLSRLMVRALTDSNFRDRLLKAGSKVRERHNWQDVANRTSEVLQRLARRVEVPIVHSSFPLAALGRTVLAGEFDREDVKGDDTFELGFDEPPARLKVGLYDRFWSTMGGGEQHAGAAAVALSRHFDVELIGIEDFDRSRFAKLLGRPAVAELPLRIIGHEPTAVARASADYDIFVNHSYTSEDFCLARLGMYVTFFPQVYVSPTSAEAGPIAFVPSSSWRPAEAIRDQLIVSPGGVLEVDVREDHHLTFIASGDGDLVLQSTLGTEHESVGVTPRVVSFRLTRGRSRIEYTANSNEPLRISSPQSGAGHRIYVGPIDQTARPAFVTSYQLILGNSEYTSDWIRRRWNCDASTHYPPVELRQASSHKENRILNVGRFFGEESGHCKQQLRLVRAFKRMVAEGLSDWTLVLVGGVDRQYRDYALEVRRAAAGYPIEVLLNADFGTLNAELARASIYWHATGLGAELDRFPERAEHFGIAPVEAMSTGAIPIVFAAGGPREVVREGIDGFFFTDEADLIERTSRIIAMPEADRANLRRAAVARAADFSGDRFAEELLRHADNLLKIDIPRRPLLTPR